jgi:hypothetical protein
MILMENTKETKARYVGVLSGKHIRMDANKTQEQQHPEKKQRRASTVAQTPEAVPRRKSSSGATKPPASAKKPKAKDDTSPQQELVDKISELRNTNRQNVVKYLKKCMSDHAKRLVDEKKISLQPDSTLDSLVENRALQIEHHVYLNHFAGGQIVPEYQKRCKSIASNLKSNSSLSDKILEGQLSCERLSQMTTEEMASKELKELMQQVRMESEKHNTLINDTGPRIRRTHKGEELVSEDSTAQSAQDTLLDSGNIVRRHSEHIDDVPPSTAPGAPISPVMQSPTQLTEASVSPPAVVTNSVTPRSPSQPSPIEGSAPSAAEKRSFNIEKVWSHVESPDTDRRPRLPSTSHAPPPTTTAQNKIDKDIDMLLKDDDAGTPPYSPASYDDHYSPKPDQDDDSVWRGRIDMNQTANLNVTATLLGGPERIGDKRWLELVDPVLNIDGRIKHERATEYLCGQKFSRSSSMILASLKPEHSTNQGLFDRLFDYFKSKERYAVVGKHSMPCIKDLYIVPIDKDETLPDWFGVVDPPSKVPETGRSSKMLVLIFVVIRSLVPGHQENTNGATIASQRFSMQGTPGFGTPAQPQASPFPPAPHHQQQQQYQGSPLPRQQQLHQPSPQPPFSPQPPQQQQQPQYQYAYSPPQGQGQHYSPPPHTSYSQTVSGAGGEPYPLPPLQPPTLQHTYPTPGSAPGMILHQQQQPPPPPQSHLGGFVPRHPMTRELINMIPKLGERQARAIDELLQKNPELQTNPTVLAKEVEKVLGE